MASQSNYQRNGGNRSFFPSLASISSTDPGSGQIYTREMAPPSSGFPPQPVEIDLNNAHSRTLPNPSVSASMQWESAAFQSQGFGEVPYVGSIPRMSTIPNDGQNRGPPENQDPLVQWYTGNDGPWNAFSKVVTESVADDRSFSKQTGNRNPMSYSGQYRQQNPTETGNFQFAVPHSDSGYGTRRSVGNTSVFSADVHERDQDSHSMAGPVPEFQSFHGYNEALQQRDSRISGSWTPPSLSPSDSPGLVCPTCQKPVKTQSELKKHDLRHRKPFTCEVSGCSRTEGFSTTNDLDRHTKSKHPATIPDNAAIKRFRCHVPGCKSKDKAWPRRDNFRSHLQRVHSNRLPEEEIDDMIRRGEFWEKTGLPLDLTPQRHPLPQATQPFRPMAQENLHRQRQEPDWKHPYPEIIDRSQDLIARKGPQAQVFESRNPIQEEKSPQSDEQPATVQPLEVFPAPAQIPETRITLDSLVPTPAHNIDPALKASEQARSRVSPQGKTARQAQTSATDAALTEVIQKALAGASISDPSTGSRNPESERSSLPNGKTSSKDAQHAAPNAATNSRGVPGLDNPADGMSIDAFKDLEAQKKAVEVLKIIRDLGFTVSKDPTQAPKVQNPGSAASNKSENQVTCQACGRFKGRPCELKKHMKRHERPYGCTFVRTCTKEFGSKNDWKRHENSQHFHLETWRCDIPRPDETGACAKVCYRRQTFQEHLKKEHNLSDPDTVKNKIDSCRMGRNCQARFWCGFCAKTVDLKKKGLEAWGERFDHIDDHFMGRNDLPKRGIREYIPLDGQEPKGDIESPHSLSNSENSDHSPAGSPSGAEHSPAPSSQTSSACATSLEDSSAPGHSKKHSRTSSDVDYTRLIKRARPAKQQQERRVYCCQCQSPHNLRFNQCCTSCEDSHRFCGNCQTEIVHVD